MTQNNGNSSSQKNGSPLPPDGQKKSWQSILERWRIKFDRFGWDVLGILLLSAGAITLLGFVGLTEGGIVNLWIGFIQLWFGWVSYLFVFFFVLTGLNLLRKKQVSHKLFPLGKILAIEIFVFGFLAFFSILGGHSLERAEKGLDGGLVGWGLGELMNKAMPYSLAGILMGAVCIVLLLYIAGVFRWLEKTIGEWSEKVRLEPQLPKAPPIAIENVNGSTEGIFPTGSLSDEEINSIEIQDLNGTRNNRRAEYLPPLDLLREEQYSPLSEENIHDTAMDITKTLAEFGIPARVVGFRVGPTVTQFAVEPGFVERQTQEGETLRHKIRVSQISSLSRDLALALSAERLRIEAPVPGQSFVGIEVPNPKSSIVGLRPIIESEEFQHLDSSLAIAIGKDVSGRPVVADLARMPHLLIAGTTGSGKSVCIAALAVCLAMNNSPTQLKLVMLDPKMVELMRFNGLKHLFGKVETDPERILIVLKWALAEMDRRYRLFETARARNIDTYNRKPGRKKGDFLPKVVIFIDELADLMLSAPDQTEHSLVRLAQMARATGIHLVLATQRPSTDVVTGLIKANFPARISFNVASSIDSRVILDENGAETLLGKGDMLFLNPEVGKPVRAQGVIITDEEIDKIIDFWKKFDEIDAMPPWERMVEEEQSEGPDHLVEEAIKIVRKTQHASASMLQRRLRIGYPRAARLIDELEELGVVGSSQGGGREREVLLGREDQGDAEEDDSDYDDAEYSTEE